MKCRLALRFSQCLLVSFVTLSACDSHGDSKSANSKIQLASSSQEQAKYTASDLTQIAAVGNVTPEAPATITLRAYFDASNCLNCLFSLTVVKPAEWQGKILSISDTQITVEGESWAPNQFFNTPVASYGVEIGSGKKEGAWADIMGNTSNTLTVSGLKDYADVGDTIRIRKYFSLAEIFGSDNGIVKLGSKGTMDLSDVITVYNIDLSATKYWYSDGSVISAGWKDVNGNAVDISRVYFNPDRSFAIFKKDSQPIAITVTGVAKAGRTLHTIAGNSLIPTNVVAGVTLDSSGFWGGISAETGIPKVLGPNDYVYVYGEHGFDDYNYWPGPDYPDYIGWNDITFALPTEGSAIIPAGHGIYIQYAKRAPVEYFAPGNVIAAVDADPTAIGINLSKSQIKLGESAQYHITGNNLMSYSLSGVDTDDNPAGQFCNLDGISGCAPVLASAQMDGIFIPAVAGLLHFTVSDGGRVAHAQLLVHPADWVQSSSSSQESSQTSVSQSSTSVSQSSTSNSDSSTTSQSSTSNSTSTTSSVASTSSSIESSESSSSSSSSQGFLGNMWSILSDFLGLNNSTTYEMPLVGDITSDPNGPEMQRFVNIPGHSRFGVIAKCMPATGDSTSSSSADNWINEANAVYTLGELFADDDINDKKWQMLNQEYFDALSSGSAPTPLNPALDYLQYQTDADKLAQLLSSAPTSYVIPIVTGDKYYLPPALNVDRMKLLYKFWLKSKNPYLPETFVSTEEQAMSAQYTIFETARGIQQIAGEQSAFGCYGNPQAPALPTDQAIAQAAETRNNAASPGFWGKFVSYISSWFSNAESKNKYLSAAGFYSSAPVIRIKNPFNYPICVGGIHAPDEIVKTTASARHPIFVPDGLATDIEFTSFQLVKEDSYPEIAITLTNCAPDPVVLRTVRFTLAPPLAKQSCPAKSKVHASCDVGMHVVFDFGGLGMGGEGGGGGVLETGAVFSLADYVNPPGFHCECNPNTRMTKEGLPLSQNFVENHSKLIVVGQGQLVNACGMSISPPDDSDKNQYSCKPFVCDPFAGETMNASMNDCVCMEGWEYDESIGGCKPKDEDPPPSCTGGAVTEPETGNCVCPEGKTWDAGSELCKDICDPDKFFHRGSDNKIYCLECNPAFGDQIPYTIDGTEYCGPRCGDEQEPWRTKGSTQIKCGCKVEVDDIRVVRPEHPESECIPDCKEMDKNTYFDFDSGKCENICNGDAKYDPFAPEKCTCDAGFYYDGSVCQPYCDNGGDPSFTQGGPHTRPSAWHCCEKGFSWSDADGGCCKTKTRIQSAIDNFPSWQEWNTTCTEDPEDERCYDREVQYADCSGTQGAVGDAGDNVPKDPTPVDEGNLTKDSDPDPMPDPNEPPAGTGTTNGGSNNGGDTPPPVAQAPGKFAVDGFENSQSSESSPPTELTPQQSTDAKFYAAHGGTNKAQSIGAAIFHMNDPVVAAMDSFDSESELANAPDCPGCEGASKTELKLSGTLPPNVKSAQDNLNKSIHDLNKTIHDGSHPIGGGLATRDIWTPGHYKDLNQAIADVSKALDDYKQAEQARTDQQQISKDIAIRIAENIAKASIQTGRAQIAYDFKSIATGLDASTLPFLIATLPVAGPEEAAAAAAAKTATESLLSKVWSFIRKPAISAAVVGATTYFTESAKAITPALFDNDKTVFTLLKENQSQILTNTGWSTAITFTTGTAGGALALKSPSLQTAFLKSVANYFKIQVGGKAAIAVGQALDKLDQAAKIEDTDPEQALKLKKEAAVTAMQEGLNIGQMYVDIGQLFGQTKLAGEFHGEKIEKVEVSTEAKPGEMLYHGITDIGDIENIATSISQEGLKPDGGGQIYYMADKAYGGLASETIVFQVPAKTVLGGDARPGFIEVGNGPLPMSDITKAFIKKGDSLVEIPGDPKDFLSKININKEVVTDEEGDSYTKTTINLK